MRGNVRDQPPVLILVRVVAVGAVKTDLFKGLESGAVERFGMNEIGINQAVLLAIQSPHNLWA